MGKLNAVIRETYIEGLTLDDFAYVVRTLHSLGASYGRRLRELATEVEASDPRIDHETS